MLHSVADESMRSAFDTGYIRTQANHDYGALGKSAINALLKENYAKNTAKGRRAITTREEAHQLLLELGINGFILHVDRGESSGGKGTPKVLKPNQLQAINEDWYYMWIWEGSQIKLYIGAAALVATVLAAVMFPLWPAFLRLGVWYLSVGVLGLLGVFFGIAIIRLILFVVTMFTVSPGIWLFPNLFEDVGIVDSFIPFWGWEEPKKKKSKASTEAANVGEESASAGIVAEAAGEKED